MSSSLPLYINTRIGNNNYCLLRGTDLILMMLNIIIINNHHLISVNKIHKTRCNTISNRQTWLNVHVEHTPQVPGRNKSLKSRAEAGKWLKVYTTRELKRSRRGQTKCLMTSRGRSVYWELSTVLSADNVWLPRPGGGLLVCPAWKSLNRPDVRRGELGLKSVSE